jgi:hypothetical protein
MFALVLPQVLTKPGLEAWLFESIKFHSIPANREALFEVLKTHQWSPKSRLRQHGSKQSMIQSQLVKGKAVQEREACTGAQWLPALGEKKCHVIQCNGSCTGLCNWSCNVMRNQPRNGCWKHVMDHVMDHVKSCVMVACNGSCNAFLQDVM